MQNFELCAVRSRQFTLLVEQLALLLQPLFDAFKRVRGTMFRAVSIQVFSIVLQALPFAMIQKVEYELQHADTETAADAKLC